MVFPEHWGGWPTSESIDHCVNTVHRVWTISIPITSITLGALAKLALFWFCGEVSISGASATQCHSVKQSLLELKYTIRHHLGSCHCGYHSNYLQPMLSNHAMCTIFVDVLGPSSTPCSWSTAANQCRRFVSDSLPACEATRRYTKTETYSSSTVHKMAWCASVCRIVLAACEDHRSHVIDVLWVW